MKKNNIGWIRFNGCVAAVMLAFNASIVLAESYTTNIINGVTTSASSYILGDSGPFNVLIITNSGTFTVGGAGSKVGNGSAANNNTALVTGAGSIWNSGYLNVGMYGSGNRLTVTNGGVLTAVATFMGYYASAVSNAIIVAGHGSVLNGGSEFKVGTSGTFSQLMIANGGRVVVDGPGYMGSTSLEGSKNNSITVTGSGSVWSNNAALYVGFNNAGNQLLIANGGQVHDTDGRVGESGYADSNVVLVTGTNSLWNNSGGFRIGTDTSGNSLTITNNGAVAVAGNAYVGWNLGAGNRITLASGSLSVTNAGGTGTLDVRRGTLTVNGGAVSADQLLANTGASGIITFNGGTLNTKATAFANGSSFTVGNGTGAATLNLQGGTHNFANGLVIAANAQVCGAATINASVTSSGSVAPGASVGTLAILNTYTQNAAGSLNIELGGIGSSDVLSVGGTAQLGGTLNVTNVNGFTPAVSNDFTILTAQTVAGTFGTVNLPALGGGMQWSVLYSTTSVVLRVEAYIVATYVATNGLNVAPYDTWAKAASTLQSAVDVVSAGGTVWVSNGVYAAGGAANGSPAMSNRVSITKAITVRSANGAAVTFIKGASDPATGGLGTNATRCVYMTAGLLAGFTLTNGYTRTDGDWNTQQGGGGALVKSGSIISNCVVTGCNAAHFGGGLDLSGGDAWNCTLTGNTSYDGGGLLLENGRAYNCLVRGNRATHNGGGAFSWQNGLLANCTVVSNTAVTSAGGTYFNLSGTNLNTIVYFNTTNGVAHNYTTNAGGVFLSSCTTPAASGTGNITGNPLFVNITAGDCRLQAGSPCINAGANQTWMSHALDLDGAARILGGLADMGVYESDIAPPGKALAFDGTADYVSIADANSLDMTSNYTLECWFKADSFGSGGDALNLRGLIGKYQTSGSSGYLLRMNLKELEFDQMVTSGLNLESNRWYHVAAVNSNGTRRLYVNGVEKALTGSAITVVANTDELRLGSDYRGRYFAGQMDEVRIWSAARAQPDIQDAMHRQLAGNEAGLVAYYNFNVNAGTFLPDLTANDNNGTLVSGPVWTNSTIPCANAIAGRSNIRGVWLAQTNGLASSRFSVTNAAVTSTNFAVFGHDGGTEEWQSSDLPTGMVRRLTRAWQTEVSGSATGTIRIDTTGLSNIGDGSKLKLLVDADGIFSNATAVSGSFVSPHFTVSGQVIAGGSHYTLGSTALFNDSGVSLPGVDSSALAWGDYNNDGKLDILLTGYTGSGWISRIYRNNGDGTFTDINAGLLGVQFGAVAWGDFNNDGWLDILLTGHNGSDRIFRMYRNNGDNTFTRINVGLTGVDRSAAAWGDYNNDGLLDILVAGTTGSASITTLYRNNGNNTFTAVSAGLPGVASCSVAWGDYDNDGLLDILLAGDTGSTRITGIYRNNGNGTFTDSTAGLPGVSSGQAAWGDYDNDGFLDILLTGYTGSAVISKIYHSEGNGTFTDISAALTSVYDGAAAWGDYDNDGRLDILLSGNTDSGRLSRIYRNNGNSTFTDINAGLTNLCSGAAAWGDYDNDGRLDVLLTGLDATGLNYVTKLYHNVSVTSNTVPAAPTGLAAGVTGDTVALSWNAASDSQTPVAGLTYNMRVGTSSGAADIFPGMSDTASGVRRIAALGNAGDNRSLLLTLTRGRTYTWSVQALDSAFAGGLWATEGTFYVMALPIATTAAITNIAAGSAQSGGTASSAGGTAITAKGICWNTNGTPTLADTFTVAGSGDGGFSSTLTGLTAGGQTYHVRAYATSTEGTGYGVERVFATPMATPQGNALAFDGANDYVAVADTNDLDLTRTYTLEVWFKADAFGGLRCLISKYEATYANCYFIRLNGTELDFDGKITSGLNLQPGIWYHVAAVNNNNGRHLYVNGVEQTLSGSQPYLSANGDTVRLGSDLDGSYFSGQLDEARIWNTARSVDQIRDAMHRQLAGSESGLVACYNFNHAGGAALADVTANNHTGTLVNGLSWTASTVPLANAIASRTNLRGVWVGNTNSLASSRLSLIGSGVSAAQFVVLGHDNAADAWQSSDVPPEVTHRLTRAWKTETDSASSGTIRIDTTGFTGLGDGSRLRLLVDSDSTFSNAAALTGSYGTPYFSVTGQTVPDGVFYTLGNVPEFTEQTGAGLPAVQNSAAAWGDYDNDGLLDLLLAGNTGSSKLTRIYHNNGDGTFSDLVAGLPGIEKGSVAWGDYDNDGWLDILLTGSTGSDTMTRIYHNNGDNSFTYIVAGLPGCLNGKAAWGDYDNDGKLDVLLAGKTGSGRLTAIYRNNGDDTFTDIGAGLPGLDEDCSVAWGDYDNDGRLDILLTGYAGSYISKIYHNHGDGTFTDITAGLLAVRGGTVAWGDYNNDGLLDFLLTGYGDSNGLYIFRIYRNNGGGTFTGIDAGLPGIVSGNAAWGDYDNDGRLDIVVAGHNGSATFTRLYHNNGTDTFTEINTGLQACQDGAAVWGDYNADGRLDLLLTGATPGSPMAKLYSGNALTVNTVPAAPTGLSVTVTNDTATLSWTAASDSQTPAAGLTYNVRVGTAPGAANVLSCMANLATGQRRIQTFGNSNTNSWQLTLPQGGTCYWSAQAVDTALAGGAWATEGSFHIRALPSVTTDPVTGITASTAHSGGNVASAGDSPVMAKGLVWNTNANPTVTNCLGITDHGAGTGSFADTLASLTSGQTFYLRAYATNSLGASYGTQRIFTTPMTSPGNALQLDGANDYVSIADADDLDMTSNYTLETWFKADSFGAAGALRGLIGKYQTSGANGYFMRLAGTNFGFDGMTASSLNLQTNTWYHVAAVNSNNTRRLYLNGAAQTLGGSPITVQANSDQLTLGSDFLADNNRFFDGQMEETRIWNVVRSQAEIQANMGRELAGSESGLVAYYNFNHIAGTFLSDVAGKEHDGTLVNGPVWVTSTIPLGWILTAAAGAHGTISPAGSVVVLPGGSTNFVITSDTDWHVGAVTTNGVSIGAVTSFTWSNVVADGTINASFAADLAAQGTPHWWLAQYGLTNAGWTFDQAETNKTDSDAFDNGQEYIADTNPTNPASSFVITSISNSPTTTVSFVSSASRAYTLIGVSNLSSSAWLPVPGAGPRLGTGGQDSLSDTNVPPKGPFYKLQVELP